MRQRTEVFASIILLATVLRQGKKKRKRKKKDCIKRAFLNFIDCMTFDTLTNNKTFIATFTDKRNSKCLLYKYCKNNKTVSEFQMHSYENAHTCT